MAALDATILSVFDNNVKEKAWAAFLASLMPWELHKLLQGELECMLHDAFCDGLLSLRDARLTLSYEEYVSDEE